MDDIGGKKDNVNRPRHKALIIWDSHARGMAIKLRHNREEDCSVQGLVKPGADLEATLGLEVNDIKSFTKNDVLLVWGGTKDVSRNKTEKGLTQIRKFVRDNSQTNVMLVNLPYRQDLEATFCVNQEIKVFNRKLYKHIKSFDHSFSLEVLFEKEHYTGHGFHLNVKGKDIVAKIFVSAIKGIFNKSKVIPIIANGKETQEVNSGMNEQLDCSPKTANRQAETSQYVASHPRMTGRERKNPVTRSSDFFMVKEVSKSSNGVMVNPQRGEVEGF
jgi:hypothetical protein